MAWAEEQGQIKSGVGPFLREADAAATRYVNREQFPTRGDKAVRARSIQGRMALDGLYYPKNAPWVADWLAELLNFPASKHDDQVDAMGLVGQLLDNMVSGTRAEARSDEAAERWLQTRSQGTENRGCHDAMIIATDQHGAQRRLR